MMELSLSKERLARVWLNERPHGSSGRPHKEYFRRVEGAQVTAYNRICTVELLIPLGGRFNYGLLGCSISNSKVQTRGLIVDVNMERDEPYRRSLANNLESVLWGLDEEFADSVLDGAARGISLYGNPGGQIHFDVAAHGDLGATPRMFQRLGLVLIAIAAANFSNGQDITSLLESCLLD